MNPTPFGDFVGAYEEARVQRQAVYDAIVKYEVRELDIEESGSRSGSGVQKLLCGGVASLRVPSVSGVATVLCRFGFLHKGSMTMNVPGRY